MLFLKKVSDYAVKYKNIHLPLFYNYLKCDEFNKFDLLLPNNINVNKKLNNYNYKNEYSTSYYSIFAELADGDIYKYLENTNITQKKLYNIISQCFMAIISIHNNGIYHRDTHTGNFLYHNIEPNGCIKYKYKDLIFYIENIGYNWVIWDFGRSKEIKESNKFKLYEDLELLIESIVEILFYDSNNDSNSNNDSDNKKGLKEILKIIDKNKDDYLIIKQIFENNILFSKEPIGKIIATVNLK
jgi:serine/threonine protein kinase